MLEVFEDLERGHCYKIFMRKAALEFLSRETKDNAFAAYRAFLDSYRIWLKGATKPFIDLLDVLKSYEVNATVLIDRHKEIPMNTETAAYNNKATTAEAALISALHIHKAYGGRPVLRDVSLDVRHGEAVALVGENGCGKSTLLRLLCRVTPPDGGIVSIAPEIRAALIPDRFEKINMSAARFIEYMRGMENADAKAAVHYCEMFAITAYLSTPLKYLSKGMLQKVAVIQALLGERDVLFMDEPLSGQDAVSQLRFADEIRRRKRDGMAVVMACHEPFLIEALADRVLQIKDGILADGTGYLTQSAIPRCVVLVFPNGADIDALVQSALPSAQVSPCGQMARIETDRAQGPVLLALLLERGIRIVKYEETL